MNAIIRFKALTANKRRIKYYSELFKEVHSDFPKVEKKYDEILVIIASTLMNPSIDRMISKFLGAKVRGGMTDVAAKAISYKQKAAILIGTLKMQKYPKWKRRFTLRHEFAHLEIRERELPQYQKEALKKYRPYNQLLEESIKAYHDYEVSKLLLDLWPDDWLRNEEWKLIEIKRIISPKKAYNSTKQRFGLRMALNGACFHSIKRVCNIMACNFAPSHMQSRLAACKEAYIQYTNRLKICIDKDFQKAGIPSIIEWLNTEHFINEKTFFKRILEFVQKLPTYL